MGSMSFWLASNIDSSSHVPCCYEKLSRMLVRSEVRLNRNVGATSAD